MFEMFHYFYYVSSERTIAYLLSYIKHVSDDSFHLCKLKNLVPKNINESI